MDKKIAPLVETINALGLPTYSSCENQHSFPIVGIKLELNEGETQALVRLMGMLGSHNIQCHDPEEIMWTLLPRGNICLQLLPIDHHQSREAYLQGITTLVERLQAMNRWYHP